MNRFTKSFAAAAVSASMVCGAGLAFAANPMVGGAAMYANKNIVQNAMHSKDHTTLVAAVKAAGLVDTLEGPLVAHAGEWVVRGDLGEEWVITAERLRSGYRPAAG